MMSEPHAQSNVNAPYQIWLQKHASFGVDAVLCDERMLRWTLQPLIHLVMWLRRGEEIFLADTLDSLEGQIYKPWHLTVVATFPPPVVIEGEEVAWVEVGSEANAVDEINQVIQSVSGNWIVLVPPGVQFEQNYLFSSVDYINSRPGWRLIYTDEDRLDADGERCDPKFKPDFNLDMLRSTPYMGLCLVRKDKVSAVGGYVCLSPAGWYDMALKVLDQCTEEAIGHIPSLLYHLPLGLDMMDWSDGKRALETHLGRCHLVAEVEQGYIDGTYRVRYRHQETPLVSIIIPTKDKLEFFKPCINRLLEETSYPNYEILVVDNQSSDAAALSFYETLASGYGDKVRILRYPEPFNFAAIGNLGAREARGTYLLFLNNDTQILHPDWLDQMLAHGQRREVGVVGVRLINPATDKIQHVGIIVGLGGYAYHPGHGIDGIESLGYMGRSQIDQNLSAVTGACLLIKKSVYEQVGGMDEEKFPIYFNDVDLCLKTDRCGYKIVWTPYVTLAHVGSVTLNSDLPRSGDRQEIFFKKIEEPGNNLIQKWLHQIASDPAYNRELSLGSDSYTPETAVVVSWDPCIRIRPRVLGMPLPCRYSEYRIVAPLRVLNVSHQVQSGLVQSSLPNELRILHVVEVERLKPDILLLHRPIFDHQIYTLNRYKEFNQVQRLFLFDSVDFDDLSKSALKGYSLGDTTILKKALALCDRLIVTTGPLANFFKGLIHDIRVVPDYLEQSVWGGLSSQRRQGRHPRIGVIGAQFAGRTGIKTVIKKMAQEVEWISLGPCPDGLQPYMKAIYPLPDSCSDYAEGLAKLNLDLAVVPMEVNRVNETYSNLRLLELGVLGCPVICTDILPFRDAPVKRVPNDPKVWTEAIYERIMDLDATEKEGDQLKEWVLTHYMLEDHSAEWFDALTS